SPSRLNRHHRRRTALSRGFAHPKTVAARTPSVVSTCCMTRFMEAAEQISSDCHANGVRKAARTLSKIYDGELKRAGLLISQLTVLVATARFGEKGAPMGT